MKWWKKELSIKWRHNFFKEDKSMLSNSPNILI